MHPLQIPTIVSLSHPDFLPTPNLSTLSPFHPLMTSLTFSQSYSYPAYVVNSSLSRGESTKRARKGVPRGVVTWKREREGKGTRVREEGTSRFQMSEKVKEVREEAKRDAKA